MSTKAIDVLIFIPLIPGIATWLLPWDRWIPEKIHNKIIGPYLLYFAFAVWHFKRSWWVTLLLGLMGIALCTAEIVSLRKAGMVKQARARKARMLERAREWPAVEGFVLHTGQSPVSDGLLKVTVSFLYRVNDEEFDGSESFTFTSRDDAEGFESRCRDRKITVRYQQDNPEVCTLDQDGLGV